MLKFCGSNAYFVERWHVLKKISTTMQIISIEYLKSFETIILLLLFHKVFLLIKAFQISV